MISTILKPLGRDADGVWQVRGYDEAKILMRSPVTQAGFQTEKMRDSPFLTSPIPAIDGDEHRERRAGIGKFFTPTTTNQQYRSLIEQFADEALAAMPVNDVFDFKDYSTRIASDVVCEILGLKHSIRGGLIDRFLHVAEHHDVGALSLNPKELMNMLTAARTLLSFWILDIRPAIRANRAAPTHNLISHMIEKGYNPLSIMIECITYGFAGILTTREFMCSALELCLKEPKYHDLMRHGDDDSRTRFLCEVLRLNPVTSHLTRRASEDIMIDSEGQQITIQQNDLMVFNIFEINTDARLLGDDALDFRADRDYKSRIMWSMFAFGFGAHRCPGEALAILETDIMLQKLLTRDIEVIDYPTRGFNDPTKTNELYDFHIQIGY